MTKSSGTILSANPVGVNPMDEANNKSLFLELPYCIILFFINGVIH